MDYQVQDMIESCNQCRYGKNRLIAQPVVSGDKIVEAVVACSACGHQAVWKDGMYSEVGNAVKIIEYKSTEVSA